MDGAMFQWSWFLVSLLLTYSAADEFEPCGGKPADVFFLLDSSGSISKEDFQKELNFTKDVASMFDTTPGKVRVGVLSFSRVVIPQFGLGDYSSKNDMLDKIGSVTYEGLGTNTGEALSFLHAKGLAPNLVRPGIPHIGIILTDGMSQDRQDTLQEAQLVHEAGITVFVIGIGGQVDAQELAAIGSKPTGNYVNTIESFDALASIKEALAIKACKVEPILPQMDIQNTQAEIEQELMAAGSCTPKEPLDVTFAIDTTGIGTTNARYVLNFIGNLSDRLNMAAGDTSFSAVTSECFASHLSNFAAFSSEAVKQGLSSFDEPAYDELLKTMRMRAADARRGTNHVGVIFVADWLAPSAFQQSLKQMRRARFQKTSVFVIGVGESYKEDEARSLVTLDGKFLKTASFLTLGELETPLLYNFCQFKRQN